MTKPTPALTHEQRRDRRVKMAEAVRKGHDPQAVAGRFRVTITTVRAACAEHGIRFPRDPPVNAWTILAGATKGKLARNAQSITQVAKKHGISRARVSKVLRDARLAGVLK